MSNTGMRGIKRDILLVPLLFSIVASAFDTYSSWFFINYLNLNFAEANRLFVTDEGRLDMIKGQLASLALILVQALLLYIAWRTRRTERTKLSSIGSIRDTCTLHSYCFVFAVSAGAVIFLVAFIRNPLIFVSAMMDSDWSFSALLAAHENDNPLPVFLLLGIVMAIYWQRSFLWRYLNDDAKKKHRWLQWPYRIGFMKDDTV